MSIQPYIKYVDSYLDGFIIEKKCWNTWILLWCKETSLKKESYRKTM